MWISAVYLTLIFLHGMLCTRVSFRATPGLVEEGKSQLQKFQEFAKHPRYGDCWLGALRRVDVGCKQLNEEEQSRIALAFAHCHLQRSGRSFPICSEKSSIRECTQNMDGVAFGVYTEFFTHAHSICYYLQNEAWQEKSEDTIHRLTLHSESVAEQLEISNQIAQEMMQVQNATLQSQEEILKNGNILKKTLQDSSDGLKEVFQEMQQSASEQQLIFAEIFNRVTYLHQFVVGESNTLYSFLYSLMACITVFLLTSTQRTAGARLVLFFLVAINFYLERMVCNSVLENTKPSYEQTEKITFRIGLLRKTFTAAGFLVLAYFTLTYKDVTKQSLRILNNLQETQLKMQDFLRETEKLLTSPEGLPSGPWLNRNNICCTDSGITEDAVVTPTCTTDDLLPSKLFDAEHMEKYATSTPRKRERSGSRRYTSHKSEPIVYTVPVSEEVIPRYNLRTRKSGGTPADTVKQGRGNRGPLSVKNK